MSLCRGRYGLEWNPRQDERKPSGLGWVFALVGLVALVSFSVTLAKRWRAAAREAAEAPPSAPAAEASGALSPSAAPAAAEKAEDAPPPPAPTVSRAETEKRPVRVRNLLLRLEEAERRRDVEMAVSTIEQLRALPGSPVADLDDALARRLGDLNMHRLFALKCAQWVTKVAVKSGQSASRIAFEHGSTLASLAKLNGRDVETIRPGQELYVLDHPRFSLAVRRRTRTADLQLNGKFFKRYDLKDVTGEDGVYEVTLPIRSFWKERGLSFDRETRGELELLLPKGANVMISEL